jgi:hypothetical protein
MSTAEKVIGRTETYVLTYALFSGCEITKLCKAVSDQVIKVLQMK